MFGKIHQIIHRSIPCLLIYIFISVVYGKEDSGALIHEQGPVGVLNFLQQNEKKFLTFTSLDENKLDVATMARSLYRESKLRRHMRSRTLENKDVKSLHHFEQDTLVIVTSSTSQNWNKYLTMIGNTKIMSSIVVCIGDWSEENEKNLNFYIKEMSKNMFFYMIHINSNDSRVKILNQIVSLKNSNLINTTPLQFNYIGKVVLEKNLHGLHINCSTLPWWPYLELNNCTGKNKTKCHGEGYLADIMDIMGSRLNFTWSCDIEPNGNWGHLETISGPKNASGFWGGIQGHVKNGSYHLSISPWQYLYHRIGIFDFVNVGNGYKDIIGYYPSPPTFDPTLFLRPFSPGVWAAIVFTYASAFLFYYISSGMTNKNVTVDRSSFSATKLIFFVAWITHFLIIAFYDGALTMFFADEGPSLFTTKKDMMKAYPDWKLNLQKGNEIHFHVFADEGDKEYQMYVQLLNDSPEEFYFQNQKEAIQRMKNGRIGIVAKENNFRRYYKENPSEIKPKIIPYREMFHENLVLTPNSPLFPYLSTVALEMHEQGIFHILETKWHGKSFEQESGSSLHTVVLSFGQTILIFMVLGVAILVAVVVMGLEIMFGRIWTGKENNVRIPANEINAHGVENEIVDGHSSRKSTDHSITPVNAHGNDNLSITKID